MTNRDYSNTPASPLRPPYSYAPSDSGVSPIVSLITPFFNTGPVFHETAESVFRQSLQQWEWIIVDDCSDSADSASILKAYASRDSRIRVLRSALRSGPAAARNLGVSVARSPYIAFLDSDDLFEPTALEKWLWFLQCHSEYAMVKGFQAFFGAYQYIWREGFHSGAAILERNIVQTACMIRREIYQAVGGMDETIRGGMEDWEFWLRCANAGHWGWTIPEVLDWYRRRTSHNDRWENWDLSSRQSAFREELRRRYPRVFDNGFSFLDCSAGVPNWKPQPPVFENRLGRKSGVERLLIVFPELVLSGADQCVADLISQLTAKHSYEITVVTTLPSGGHKGQHQFDVLTPDVFTLDAFLGPRDYFRFLLYLIRSRQMDSILVSHSQLGYQLLPYLRSECPEVRCFDYVHLEEPEKIGAYAARSIGYQHFLDRTIASSNYLKDGMIARGGHRDRISVLTGNIDGDTDVGGQKERVVAHFGLEDLGRQLAEILSSRESCRSFDIGKALRASAPELAHAITEQSSEALIANHFWNQSHAPALVASRLVQHSRSSIAKSRILGTLAILRCALSGRTHRRNRELLFLTLRQSRSRRELLSSFDREFYCSGNPDVPSFGPLPLLHYVFFGFREGRHPSRLGVDGLFPALSEEPSSENINPLLWKCLRGRKKTPLEEEIGRFRSASAP